MKLPKKPWWIVPLGIIMLICLVVGLSQRTTDEGTPSPQPAVSSTPPKPPAPLTAQEKRAQQQRYGARTTIEHRLLGAGYDVQVGWLTDPKARDNSLQLVIIGEPVNRPFVYNLLGSGMRQSLKRDGFTKVLFCRHSIGDWIAEYDPQTENITWD